MKKKIILLGGTGYLGSFLATYFFKKKYEIISISSSKNKYLDKKIKQIKLNLSIESNIKKVSKFFANTNVIICVGSSNVRQEKKPLNRKDQILKNLIKFSKNTKWILISSGGTVYGKISKPAKETDNLNATSCYAKENILSEKILINNCGIFKYKYLICRLSNPYGKSLKNKKSQGLINILIKNILKKKITKLYVKQNLVRDYIHLDDVASAIYKLIQKNKKNDVYNISSGKGTSIKKILSVIKKSFSEEVKIEYKKTQNLDLQYSVISNKKLSRVGWKLKTNFREGILKTYQNFKN